MDKNIKQIEKSLKLKISARGNILYISGQEAQRARSILERLVLIVKDNRIVDNDEIEAAIRLSMDKSEAKINNIFIKTPKKKILPRSFTQAKYIENNIFYRPFQEEKQASDQSLAPIKEIGPGERFLNFRF